MTPDIFRRILVRELHAMRREVEAYPDDESPWRTVPGITNPGGTLVLHCCGNLRALVGAALDGTGYVRDRDAEFARRDVPRAELLRELDATISDVGHAIDALPEHALDTPYPEAVRGRRYGMGQLLAHLASHLAWHLGQLDYHRRIVTGEPGAIGALDLGEVPAMEG